MSVEFTQEFDPNQKDTKRLATGMKFTRVAYVNDLKYKSKYWLEKKKDKEKADLIQKINKLIDWFNEYNNYLSYVFAYDDANNRYSFQNAKEKSYRDKHLEIHRDYLLEYEHDAYFDIVKMCERLAYNRTKEFEKFLKNLENKKASVILVEIDKFKNNSFDKWKQEIQRATVHTFTFILNKVIQKDGKRGEAGKPPKKTFGKIQRLEEKIV